MTNTKNSCSFPFDSDFKAIIKYERESPEVQALKECNSKDHFEKVQDKLRIYLKQKYPTFFNIRYSDTFAFVIALIYPNLDQCTMWKDLKFHCPNELGPAVGSSFDWTFNSSFGNMKSTCVCGHSITANNSFIVYHKDSPLRIVVGCCCIEKNEIVEDFPLVKKQRKIRIKQHIQQQIDTWNDYNVKLKKLNTNRQRRNLFRARRIFTICKNIKQQEQSQIDKWNNYQIQLVQIHKPRIQQQIDTWKNYNDKLLVMHHTRSNSSCTFCRKNVKVPYKTCWGCRQTNYDNCDCGKSKQKQYPKCYTCK